MRWSWRRLLTAVAAVALTAVSCGGDDADEDETGSSDTSETTDGTDPSTTTTTSEATTVTADQPVLWPRPSSDVRFDDPVEAARSFALYYAMFTDPVVGELRAGDSRSGEVDIRPHAQAPASIALVRQLDDDNWYVVASTTENIAVETPAAGDPLTCPLAVSGQALAFEAQVDVRIDAYLPDGRRVEAGQGYVMGSGSPPPGPFAGEIACSLPDGVEEWGIVAFFTIDAASDAGELLEIAAVPVRIA